MTVYNIRIHRLEIVSLFTISPYPLKTSEVDRDIFLYARDIKIISS